MCVCISFGYYPNCTFFTLFMSFCTGSRFPSYLPWFQIALTSWKPLRPYVHLKGVFMCAATIITITLWLFLFSSWLDFQHSTDDATTPFKLQIPLSMETEQRKRDECEKERMLTNKMQFIYSSFFPTSFWYYQAIFHSICAIISLSHLVHIHTTYIYSVQFYNFISSINY